MGTELPFEYDKDLLKNIMFFAKLVNPEYRKSVEFESKLDNTPATETHTMHIDHSGKVTYNDIPDKVKAPQIYG